MSASSALKADEDGLVLTAVSLYEESLQGTKVSLLHYLNLICLYFNCMDFGYATAHNVGGEIESKASTRALELVLEAEVKFGANDELTFWRNYIPYIGWGEDPDGWTLSGDSLAPYIYISRENPTEENLLKARLFFEKISEIDGSERKRLFLARLESILKID